MHGGIDYSRGKAPPPSRSPSVGRSVSQLHHDAKSSRGHHCGGGGGIVLALPSLELERCVLGLAKLPLTHTRGHNGHFFDSYCNLTE